MLLFTIFTLAAIAACAVGLGRFVPALSFAYTGISKLRSHRLASIKAVPHRRAYCCYINFGYLRNDADYLKHFVFVCYSIENDSLVLIAFARIKLRRNGKTKWYNRAFVGIG